MTLPNGYTMQTTFWQDFTIADVFGDSAIKDTFERAFKEWKTNVIYATELAIVMSLKSCDWYDKNIERCVLYSELFRMVDDWCCNYFVDDELRFYYNTTD